MPIAKSSPLTTCVLAAFLVTAWCTATAGQARTAPDEQPQESQVPRDFNSLPKLPASSFTPAIVRITPSADSLAKKYPADAIRTHTNGLVNLSCVVTQDGKLNDCRIPWEIPMGQGFGAAALRLAKQFVVSPATHNGTEVGNSLFSQTIAFKGFPEATMPAPPLRSVQAPSTIPAPQELDDFALPPGRLAVLGTSGRSLALISLDDMKKRGERVDSTILWVHDPANPYVVFQAIRVTFDCRAGRKTVWGLKTYNEFERLDGWQLAEGRSAPNDAPDTLEGRAASASCSGQLPAPVLNDAHEAFEVVTHRVTRSQ